uniref:C-type lectin domain-containing protein n=1 Tax=Panagrolaimus sp. PS1159 TaxID=55785 RepID=A0AC35FJI6_9BILA
MFISGESYRFFTESTDNDFWIGANDMINNWSWTDNTSFDFSSWDKGQPQNNSGPLCVSSMMNGARWNANDCFIAKPYICEIKVPTCSEGWTYFESTNFCYKLIQHNATWAEAEFSCKKANAHLVSLHSYDEAFFVTYLASNITSRDGDTCNDYYQTWIGLSTSDNNTTWDWTDGTSFDYKNWGINEPNLPGIQNCVHMWTRQPCTALGWDAAPTEWDNFQCNTKIFNNVCKKARNV